MWPGCWCHRKFNMMDVRRRDESPQCSIYTAQGFDSFLRLVPDSRPEMPLMVNPPRLGHGAKRWAPGTVKLFACCVIVCTINYKIISTTLSLCNRALVINTLKSGCVWKDFSQNLLLRSGKNVACNTLETKINLMTPLALQNQITVETANKIRYLLLVQKTVK